MFQCFKCFIFQMIRSGLLQVGLDEDSGERGIRHSVNSIAPRFLDPDAVVGRQVDGGHTRAHAVPASLSVRSAQLASIPLHVDVNSLVRHRRDGDGKQVDAGHPGGEDARVRVVIVADICDDVIEVDDLVVAHVTVVGAQTGGEGDG
jgi:hypothetical protein